jgi:branched-chain amino acid transport system ATP-binding protein
LDINKGEIVGLIGPNGAGKTTLFNVISGFYKPSKGTILFKGEDITGRKPHEIASLGLVRTFQGNMLFHNFSVEKNVLVGCKLDAVGNCWKRLFAKSSVMWKEQDMSPKVEEILELFGLTSVKKELAGSLPHGYQRALGVAIALAAEPQLLMLDEPLTGMIAEEIETMMSHIKKIHEERETTILLVEHNMRAIMGLCERIAVLNFGGKICEGSPSEIQKNSAVIEAYLGVSEDVT